MKRFVITLFLASSFLFRTPFSYAEVSIENQNESLVAFQALDELALQTRAKGELPRLSNPDHAKLFERFWNVERTLGTPPYKGDDLPVLSEIMMRANILQKAYLFFSPQLGGVPDMAYNSREYQDEISRSVAYMMRAYTATLEAATIFFETLPPEKLTQVRLDGLQGMRVGVNMIISGVLQQLQDPQIRPENREILLDALAQNAAVLMAALPLHERPVLVAQIDAILPSLHETERETGLAIKSAFESKECIELCTLETQNR